MKYYISELENIDIDKLTNSTVHNQRRILAKDGLYKTVKGDVYKFKLIDDGIVVFKNYINDYTLIQSKHYWKKYRKTNHIPYHGIIQDIEYLKYGSTFSTLFVVEKIDGEIVDFYFESKEDPQHILFKRDISSFLSILM